MLLRAVWQLPSSIKFDIVALSSDVEVELDGCLVTLTLPVWDAANKTVVPPPIDLPAQPMNGDYWMWGGYS